MNAFREHHEDSIRFGYRCFDRVLLNGLIQPFQQPERVVRFFTRYRDRLVYGTDMGADLDMYRLTFRILETLDEHFYAPVFEYHWSYSGFGLDDAVLERLYRTNARRVMERARSGRTATAGGEQ